jgi:hypothetical protein
MTAPGQGQEKIKIGEIEYDVDLYDDYKKKLTGGELTYYKFNTNDNTNDNINNDLYDKKYYKLLYFNNDEQSGGNPLALLAMRYAMRNPAVAMDIANTFQNKIKGGAESDEEKSEENSEEDEATEETEETADENASKKSNKPTVIDTLLEKINKLDKNITNIIELQTKQLLQPPPQQQTHPITTVVYGPTTGLSTVPTKAEKPTIFTFGQKLNEIGTQKIEYKDDSSGENQEDTKKTENNSGEPKEQIPPPL